MKKVLLIAVLAIFGLSTTAANLRVSRTFAEKKRNTTWILRAGVNFAGMTGDGAEDCSSKTGYDVALSFQKPLSNFGMFWGMELGFGTRGYKYDETVEGYPIERDLLSHNVRFSPFTFGYAYQLNETMKVDIRLGGYVSYDFAGTFKGKDVELDKDWHYNRYAGTYYTYDLETTEFDESIGDIGNYTEIDGGIILGIGYWYKRANIDFSWQRGFVDVFEDGKIKTNNLVLRVGIAF